MRTIALFVAMLTLVSLGCWAADVAEKPVSSMPVLAVPGLGPVAPVQCVKWVYYDHPVVTKGSGDGGWVFGTEPAFDGYPASVKQPSIRVYWNCEAPTAEKPVHVIVDYKRPVAVTRYVHYYDRVETWKPWKDVDIYSSVDGENWALRQSITRLKRDFPQVLGIDKPVLARYYKIVVKSLLENVPKLHTYEIETYYGATVGNVTESSPTGIQGEPYNLRVRVVSPDAPVKGAVLRIVSAKGSLSGAQTVKVPDIARGGGVQTAARVIPLQPGDTPIFIELRVGKFLIDKRPYTIRARPKLAISDLTPSGAVVAKAGEIVKLRGRVTNQGSTPAAGVKVSWMGKSVALGNLAPGGSREFSLDAAAPSGYSEGLVEVSSNGLARTALRRAVICPTVTTWTVKTKSLSTLWNSNGIEGKMDTTFNNGGLISGWLMLFSNLGVAVPLTSVGTESEPAFAAVYNGSVIRVRLGVRKGGEDPEFHFGVIPDDPHPTVVPTAKFTIRFAVNDPKIMFRPHQDLFTKEHGPNSGYGNYTHYAPTRMLTVQTDVGTVSMVPDIDAMSWGYAGDFSMQTSLDIDLADPDPLGQGIWQPIWKGPMSFSIALPMRKGDHWDAYRHVVKDIFKFEQARQWAMPLTQMQMLNVRELERPENWSTIFNTMRSYPNCDFHYNFYGTTYTIPALYSYFLATDDEVAQTKAEAVKDWLIGVQESSGPLEGGWFSQYLVKGAPPQYLLEGTDQAGNRWMLPHSTGTSVKTLLWYYEASGKKDEKALASARRGCDFLIARQRTDGGWPYAYELDGKVKSEQADAGQIWCTWALWKMWEFSGDEKYRVAALKSKDFFVKTFYENHNYVGYWEDVSGSGGNVGRSSETYEAAIACQAFVEMGDPELALKVARDSAVSLWTRVVSTRQYETCYGQTIEQGSGGPSQAQSPMVGAAMQRMYEISGDRFWNDLSGAVKAIHFCADPDQYYGMCAIAGWDECLTGTICPPIDNVKSMTRPAFGGRGVWNEWQTAQYAWFALDWLVREANMRAPEFVKIDPTTLRGTVLGSEGRVKMPEERCTVTGIDHYDINWAGFSNDKDYVLIVMNHQEKTTVAVRPHDQMSGVSPLVSVGGGGEYKSMALQRKGAQYFVDIPAKSTAVLVWPKAEFEKWQSAEPGPALDEVIREGNARAPKHVSIDPATKSGTVLGFPGELRMPYERCDIAGVNHTEVTSAGYLNDEKFVLMLMNQGKSTPIMVRPHEAHLDIYTRAPRVLVGGGKGFKEIPAVRKGVQYWVDVPERSTALMIWDRIR